MSHFIDVHTANHIANRSEAATHFKIILSLVSDIWSDIHFITLTAMQASCSYSNNNWRKIECLLFHCYDWQDDSQVLYQIDKILKICNGLIEIQARMNLLITILWMIMLHIHHHSKFFPWYSLLVFEVQFNWDSICEWMQVMKEVPAAFIVLSMKI